MKDKIAFIAVGQAGGNIGSLLEKRGFTVLYFNTSQEDLNITNGKFKYHINEGEGCNKNRRKSKQLIIEDFDNIFKEIDSKIKADMIYIIFAAGGGTGSGSSPMLTELLIQQNDNKKIGLITILPEKDESIKTQMNCYECFAEINDIEGLSSCFILDNDKKNKMSINSLFVDSFCSFISIPEKHKSVRGNIDKAEIIETLSAPGCAMIVSSDKSSDFLNKFKDNIFASIEEDHVIKYITASLSNNITVKDIENTVGTPFDSFKTYNKEKTICCISGLSFPGKRLEEIYSNIENNKDNINKKISPSKIKKMKNVFDFLDKKEEVKSDKKSKDKADTPSKKDIMSKYLK